MLDIAGQPVLDKAALVGGCLRMPMRVDAARLRGEVERLPPALWGSPGGRVGVQRAAEAVFLRGHAPAAGDLPIEDRPPLDELPYVRAIIETQLPAPPQRCLLARLAAGDFIAPHIDRAPYFNKTIRIHVPVVTHALAYMWSDGECYVMQPGEVWALNNCAPHAVWNAHATQARTHLICDFLSTPALLKLLANSERNLGTYNKEVEDFFARMSRGAAADRA
jgi:Aspartyl/Asparaginyl beta-hydroxylase